jgi:large subunit ribosomal protein L25
MELNVQLREILGKKARVLRREDLIPAELYGHGVSNVHLAVPGREFMKVFKEAGTNTLVMLALGKEKRPVLIHDIQRDYLSDRIAHVDFYQVSLEEEIKAKVPIEYVGESPAVKEKGGILNKSVSELEVEALPAHLPHRLVVHLEKLVELNQSFYVRDLEVPQGVTMLVEPETVLVTVTPPLVEEEKPAATPDVATVKVEGEEKKAKRAAQKEAPSEA